MREILFDEAPRKLPLFSEKETRALLAWPFTLLPGQDTRHDAYKCCPLDMR
jgi:hypothetical protein